jgi:hypothetical protein
MTTTAQTPREKLTAHANAQPLSVLCTSLLMLDAKAKLDSAERLVRATIIDTICEKSPEADAAFTAWAYGDDDSVSEVEVIVAAVKAA